VRASASFKIILSGFCFGFLGIWGKWAYSLGLTYGELLGVRFLLAALVLLAYITFKNKGRDFPWMRPREILLCLAMGVFGYAVFSSLYFYALTGLSVSLSVLLFFLFPIPVAIGARLFLGEALGARGRWALPIAVFGTALLVWGEFNIQTSSAFLAGLLAAITYATYVLVSRRYTQDLDPLVSAMWSQLGTGVVLTALHFDSLNRFYEVVRIGWAPITGVAIISSVFAMTLFLSGIKHLKASDASILNTSEPLTAVIMASLFFGERLSFMQTMGGLLAIVAVLLIATRRERSSLA
jgi:drug/metabolite transporter (DMT)-like permease